MRCGLVGGLIAALIAAGCGGSLSVDPVASAADRTLDKQTARFEMVVKVGSPQLGSTTIGATGRFDASKQAVAATMDVPGLGAATSSLELRMLYPVTYLRFDALPLPADKSWIRVDLQKAANALGVTLPQLRIGGNPSPTDALAQLRGSNDGKKVGTDTVDGVTATHYRVKIDLDKALSRATPQQRKALKQLIQTARRNGVEVVPTHADVWIGEDDLVRRFTEKFGTVGSITMTFSDYGAPIEIEAPPAAETYDFSKLG